MSKLKLIYSPLFLSIFIFIFYQLTVFNIFSGLLDEGYLLYNAGLISQGQIPYRDFFMTTTPGSLYVVAFFFNLFGNYVIFDRILGIFAGILTLFICNKLFKLKGYWQYIYLISLALFSVAPARAFFYNDAILFALISLYFLIKGVEKNNITLVGVSGIFSGICFIFKQSVGGLLFSAFILGIFLISNKKSVIKNISSHITGWLSILIPFTAYFYFNNALPQALYFIFSFANSVKSHQSSFLVHRIIAIPLIILLFIFLKRVNQKMRLLILSLTFLVSLFYLLFNMRRIGRLLTYLPDPIFYVHTLAFIFPLIILSLSIRKKGNKYKSLTLVAISYLVLFLSIAASGYSMGPAVTVAPLLIPLVIYFSETYGKTLLKDTKIVTSVTSIAILSYTMIFSNNPFHLNDPIYGAYLESQYTKTADIKEIKYIRFPASEAEDLMRVVSYVQKNTKKHEKIFCFPYCPGLLFLSERSGGSFYNLFYFETFMAKDQDSVIHDLQKNNVRLAILQKRGGFEQRKELEEKRLPKIRSYILKNYSKVLETSNFIILKKLK